MTLNEAHPIALLPFSIAIKSECKDYDCFVHFFEDDYRFERIWNNPEKYLPKLRLFAGVIMPDFSTSLNFPKPLKFWNAYRNQALGSWFQRNGLITIPNARHQPGCDYLIEAQPQESVIAICGRACVRNLDDRRAFVRDVKSTVDELNPDAIVYYGSDLHHVMDYPRSKNIPVWVYPGCGRGELDGGRHGELK